MSEIIDTGEFVALLRETFDRGQELTFTPSGRSMLPTLNGVDDKVTLSPKPDRLRKYDVAMFIHPRSGQLVLHRVIGFESGGGYIFCGDGQYGYERGIGDDDVIALMTAFTHEGTSHSVGEKSYRSYSRRLVFKKKLRRFLKLVRRKLGGKHKNDQQA